MSLDRIFDMIKQWGRPWAAGAEPIEIHRALLEDIEGQAVAVGGGRRVFPFDRVEATLLVSTPEERSRMEAIAQAGWDLEGEVQERLRARGVEIPAGLKIIVQVTEERGPELGGRRYALTYRRVAASESARPQTERGRQPERPALRLAVLKGEAARDAYELAADHVYLGRLEEVVDATGRVKRRNDVAFREEGDLNQTVSREHARIAWDPQSRAFWLRDEGSASGTLVLRGGRPIEVSRHDRRGVRLESGDEVYLGRAAVKVEIQG